jgi:hypothetical protein
MKKSNSILAMSFLLTLIIGPVIHRGFGQEGDPGDLSFAAVLAPSGLVLRDGPTTTSKKITVIPLGAKVRVLGKDGPEDIIGGMQSRWFQVRYGTQSGWAFGGFLQEGLPLVATMGGEVSGLGDLMGTGKDYLGEVKDQAQKTAGKCHAVMDEPDFTGISCDGGKARKAMKGLMVEVRELGENDDYAAFEVTNNPVGFEEMDPEPGQFPGGAQSPEYKEAKKNYESMLQEIDQANKDHMKIRGIWLVDLKKGVFTRVVNNADFTVHMPLFFLKHNVIYYVIEKFDAKKQKNYYREMLYDIAGKKAVQIQ